MIYLFYFLLALKQYGLLTGSGSFFSGSSFESGFGVSIFFFFQSNCSFFIRYINFL
jgi:hypothetical protein